MKKIFKFFLILLIIFVVLFLGAFLAFKMMFPTSKIKAQIQEQVKAKLNREVDFKDVSLSLKGLQIKDFALSEKTTFKDGTFISAKTASAEIDIKELLNKQIKIESIGLENLTINLIKDKEGKWNFDDLISKENQQTPSENQTQQENSLIAITAKHLYTTQASIHYKDEQSGMEFNVDKLNIEINDFDFEKDFSLLISFTSKINTPALTLDPVVFNTEAKINLAALDLPKAKAEIIDFSTTYEDASLKFNGLIADFSAPQINLTGTLNGIDDKLISKFSSGEVTPFSMPVINLIISAKANTEQSNLDISQAKASLGNSYIKTKFDLDYSKADIAFTSNTDISISLDEVAQIAKETLSNFNLKGTISGNMNIAQDKDLKVKGKLNLKNVGAKLMDRNLENTSGTITLNSLEDIFTNKLTGNFGGSPWNLTLAYKKQKNTSLDLVFYMKNFTLDDINFETLLAGKEDSSKQENKEQSANQKDKKQITANTDLYDLKADITIDKIENNVLTANNFTIKADIKDFDLSLAKAQGSLTLDTKETEIRNIDKLMASSKLLKVIFTSVKIVQKAFNFAKLDNSSLTNGIINCSMLSADYTLKDGIVNINKSDIDSDLTVVRTSGKADLLNDSIDMKIQAQLGKTGSKGFKPVVIKVKGPISEPSYKVDVLSSVASIMKGSAEDNTGKDKNIISNAGDMVKTISNLFKK